MLGSTPCPNARFGSRWRAPVSWPTRPPSPHTACSAANAMRRGVKQAGDTARRLASEWARRPSGLRRRTHTRSASSAQSKRRACWAPSESGTADRPSARMSPTTTVNVRIKDAATRSCSRDGPRSRTGCSDANRDVRFLREPGGAIPPGYLDFSLPRTVSSRAASLSSSYSILLRVSPWVRPRAVAASGFASQRRNVSKLPYKECYRRQRPQPVRTLPQSHRLCSQTSSIPWAQSRLLATGRGCRPPGRSLQTWIFSTTRALNLG